MQTQRVSSFLKSPTLKGSLLFLAAASAAALAAALVAQFGFRLYPCELCLLQRYPYVMVVAIGLAGAYVPASEKIRRMAALLCAALLLLGAGIAFYHTGVELEWFAGPDACSSKSTGGETIEELRNQILHAPLVSCSQAMAYVFGLSLAAWNTIFAFSLAAWTLFAVFRRKSS